MKKSFLILAIVAGLLLPVGAMAATEFSLGGFIKLDAFWDSTQEGKNMNTPVLRNNDPQGQHGRMKFTSQGTRFNFTIKGPKLWGATTTGFIEMDFDTAEEGAFANTAGFNATLNRGVGASASHSYTPRLRSAFFRMNWPETELLIGQYFTFASQWFPELCQDGPFQITGTPTARTPMIKLTQKFAGAWSVGAMVGSASAISNNQSYSAVNFPNANSYLNDSAGGESAEAPQVQAQVEFAQDLYGKAAWYGVPKPFTAQVNFGWQRNVFQERSNRRLFFIDENNMSTIANGANRHTTVDPWYISGSLFIPVIPTHSANLAGTASLQTSWWVGQGVEAFGWTSFGSQVYRHTGFGSVAGSAGNTPVFDVVLMPRFGGQIQAQYYFTNQWYLTGAWGISKAFGLGAADTGAVDIGGGQTRNTAFAFSDVVNYHNELDLCLWYRPIQAFKFGLQYAYARTNYLQSARGVYDSAGVLQSGNNSNQTDRGEAHRIEFVGLFFF